MPGTSRRKFGEGRRRETQYLGSKFDGAPDSQGLNDVSLLVGGMRNLSLCLKYVLVGKAAFIIGKKSKTIFDF